MVTIYEGLSINGTWFDICMGSLLSRLHLVSWLLVSKTE